MIELSHDSMLILFGMFTMAVLDVFFSIANYFLEKAFYYRNKRKKERDDN